MSDVIKQPQPEEKIAEADKQMSNRGRPSTDIERNPEYKPEPAEMVAIQCSNCERVHKIRIAKEGRAKLPKEFMASCKCGRHLHTFAVADKK